MKSLYSHFGQNNGCFAHRVLWPLRYCSEDFPDWKLDVSPTDPSRQYDVYYLYNLLSPESVECCGKWKRKGGKVVIGLDDALDRIPEFNTCKLAPGALSWMEVSKDVADLIICSTPALATAVDRHNKTVVARNLMEIESYGTKSHNKGADKMRILWAGSRTHSADLDILSPVVDRVLTEFGTDNVEFVFIGSFPSEAGKKWLNRGLHFEYGVDLSLYPKLLATVKPQIVLAPLVDCEFNACKSGIRVYEGSALAAPVVASPVGEYALAVDHGQTGYLCNTPDEWFESIATLLENADLREQMGNAGRQRAAERWDWSRWECRAEWRAAFERAFDLCE